MNTPVPGTRSGGSWNIDWMNRVSGIVSWRIRSASASRPRFQVISRAWMARPRASGNQPPSKIFTLLALKKAKSTTKNNTTKATAQPSRQRHRARTTTKASTVSIIIVRVTAMP